MELKNRIKINFTIIFALVIAMALFLNTKTGNFSLVQSKIAIKITEADKETRYNKLAQKIIKDRLYKEGYNVEFTTEYDPAADYSYISKLASLVDGEDTILKWDVTDVNEIYKTISKIEDKQVVVLTTNKQLNAEVQVVLNENTILSNKYVYLLYDIYDLNKYIWKFDGINVAIPSYYYNAFYFANIKYVYENDIAKLIINDINNDSVLINETKVYPIAKDYYSFLEPLKEKILY